MLCARFTSEPARWRLEPWFSYDVTAAKVVILSSETAAMLVSKTNLWNSILGKLKYFALVQNFGPSVANFPRKVLCVDYLRCVSFEYKVEMVFRICLVPGYSLHCFNCLLYVGPVANGKIATTRGQQS